MFLLSDNLFIFNHSITLPSSILIKTSAFVLLFMSLKEYIVLDNVVSSAYIKVPFVLVNLVGSVIRG